MKIPSTLLTAAASFGMCATTHAALVINWTEGTGLTPVSNMDTASPTVGDGTPDSADSRSIYANLPTVALSGVGDKVTLSGSIALTGINTVGIFANQVRWGLYNETGTPATDTLGWLGYMAGNGSLAIGGSLFERNDGNTTSFVSGTAPGTTAIATATAPGVVLTGGTSPGVTYSFLLSLERTLSGIQIDSSFTRSSDSRQFALVDFEDTSVQTYHFNRVGFLMGNDMNADQVQFTDIDVTFIPEPSSALLGGLGMLALLRRRRSGSGVRILPG